MRITTASDVAAQVAQLSTPRVVASGNAATPFELLAEIAAHVPEWKLWMLNAPVGIPTGGGVRLETSFVGPGMRDQPALDYLPARLSMVPLLFARSHPPDVVVLHTSPPRAGRLSLGCEVNVLPAAIEAARSRGALVVAQVNAQMPYTHGDSEIPVEDVDLAVDVDRPLPSPRPQPADAVRELIADQVAAAVRPHATLQVGIGAIPDRTLAKLVAHRGLRIWSEMISDGVLDLEQAGALDPAAVITASFCFGQPALYEWVDRNPRVRMLRTERVNDPAQIATQPRMTSINTAMQVDLYAQANATYRGGRVYSGFGGQTDFIVGALHAPEGRALIALPSWHAATDTSTVVSLLGAPATSFQQSDIVSEWGSATIWGSTQREQARQLIDNVAHPRARDELTTAYEAMSPSARRAGAAGAAQG